mgnify:CR=1 FL=1
MEVEIIGPIVEGADVVKAVAAVVAGVGVFDTIVDAVAVGLGIGPLKRGNFKSFDEQLFSSERSLQSLSPSHFQAFGIH